MPNVRIVEGVLRKGETVTMYIRFSNVARGAIGDKVGCAYLQGIPIVAEDTVYSSNQRVKKVPFQEHGRGFTMRGDPGPFRYECDLRGEGPHDYINIEGWVMW
jgi:hypothetical protein